MWLFGFTILSSYFVLFIFFFWIHYSILFGQLQPCAKAFTQWVRELPPLLQSLVLLLQLPHSIFFFFNCSTLRMLLKHSFGENSLGVVVMVWSLFKGLIPCQSGLGSGFVLLLWQVKSFFFFPGNRREERKERGTRKKIVTQHNYSKRPIVWCR